MMVWGRGSRSSERVCLSPVCVCFGILPQGCVIYHQHQPPHPCQLINYLTAKPTTIRDQSRSKEPPQERSKPAAFALRRALSSCLFPCWDFNLPASRICPKHVDCILLQSLVGKQVPRMGLRAFGWSAVASALSNDLVRSLLLLPSRLVTPSHKHHHSYSYTNEPTHARTNVRHRSSLPPSSCCGNLLRCLFY